MKQRTYLMIKPDYVDQKEEIIKYLEEKFDANIVNKKEFVISNELLREHYAHIVDKPFFPEIEEYMTSGPVVGMVVEFDYDFISRTRELIGPTFDAPKGTLRGDFFNPAFDRSHNVIHSSDSPESAAAEIKRFFGEDQLLNNI